MEVVAGVDLGGTAINYTLVNGEEQFLIDGLCEHPALSKQGPEVCLQQIADGLKIAADQAGIALDDIVAIGLDTPGPSSAAGRLSARGSTNFVHPMWAGFDIREGLAHKLGKPVYLPQRCERRRALGALCHLRSQQPRNLDFRRRRHRQWGRHHPGWQRRERQERVRRRTRPRADSLPEYRRHRRYQAPLQLWTNRRPGVAVLSYRD